MIPTTDQARSLIRFPVALHSPKATNPPPKTQFPHKLESGTQSVPGRNGRPGVLIPPPLVGARARDGLGPRVRGEERDWGVQDLP